MNIILEIWCHLSASTEKLTPRVCVFACACVHRRGDCLSQSVYSPSGSLETGSSLSLERGGRPASPRDLCAPATILGGYRLVQHLVCLFVCLFVFTSAEDLNSCPHAHILACWTTSAAWPSSFEAWVYSMHWLHPLPTPSLHRHACVFLANGYSS